MTGLESRHIRRKLDRLLSPSEEVIWYHENAKGPAGYKLIVFLGLVFSALWACFFTYVLAKTSKFTHTLELATTTPTNIGLLMGASLVLFFFLGRTSAK